MIENAATILIDSILRVYVMEKHPQKTAKKPGMRMNELIAASGLPRSTIVHWIKEGLLPEPTRKNRTMAYYDPACVERAQFISKLQGQEMSLAGIRKILSLKDKGIEVSSLINLHAAVFGSKNESLLDREHFCEATGLCSEQIDFLLKSGLLMPMKGELFDEEDIMAASFYKWGFSEGLDMAAMENIKSKIYELVESNIALSLKVTRDMPLEKSTEVKLNLVDSLSDIQTYLGRRIFLGIIKNISPDW